MVSINSIKVYLVLVVLCICAQSCEKENFNNFCQNKKKDCNLTDSTKSDSTKNDSTKKGSNDKDSTGNDSNQNDSNTVGGLVPDYFSSGFVDSLANTYHVITYTNPVTVNGVMFYQSVNTLYEWNFSYPPSSVSNLKKIKSYTETERYFWNSKDRHWMK